MDKGKNTMFSENCWLQETADFINAPWALPNARRIQVKVHPLELAVDAGAGKRAIRPTY